MATSKQAKDARSEERLEGLTVERYAEVMAHRLHFPVARRTEVLLRLGIPPLRWATATKAWSARIAEALERDEPDLLVRFTKMLQGTSRKLREHPPRIEALGHPIDPNTADPEARTINAEVPTYLREEPARVPAPWAPAVPVPSAPAPPQPPPTPFLPQPTSVGVGNATADISAYVPRQSLPFAPAAAGAPSPDAGGLHIAAKPPASPASPAPFAPTAGRSPGFGETADISAFVPRELLPFKPSADKPKEAPRFDPMTGRPLTPEQAEALQREEEMRRSKAER